MKNWVCVEQDKNYFHDGKIIGFDNRGFSYEEIKKNIMISNQFCGATIMLKKEVYDNIGGYRDFLINMHFKIMIGVG